MQKIALLAISLMLVACGTSKKVTKTTTQEALQVAQVQNTQRDHNSQENVATTTTLSQDETVITQMEEFDTSQPVDPQTGTPPLKRRVTQTREQATTARQEQQAEQTVAESEKETVDTRADLQTDIDTQAESETRRQAPWLIIILAGGGLVALIVVIRKKLKTFF